MQFCAEKLQDVLAASNNYLLMRSFALSVSLLYLCVNISFFFFKIHRARYRTKEGCSVISGWQQPGGPAQRRLFGKTDDHRSPRV